MLTNVPRYKADYLQRDAVAIQEGVILPVNPRAKRGVIQVDGGGATKAGTVLTFTGQPGNNDPFVLGNQTYLMKTTYENTPYTIVIGATLPDTLANIVAGILGYDGEGAVFGAGTIEHPDVTAVSDGATLVTMTAKAYGVGANAIVTTEALTNGSFTGATMAGGTAFVGTVEPLVTIGGDLWLPPSMTPLDGGAAVTTMAAVGQWQVPTEGVTGIRAPITAWTSGLISVRFAHVADQKG